MEDAAKLALRERKPPESLAVIAAPSLLRWDQAPHEPHLLDYLIILRKHQWLILAFLIAVVTVVTISSFKMKPIYTANTKVEFDKETQNMLPFQGAQNSDDAFLDLENYLETQTKVLQSETLALQTIRSLNLNQFPEFGQPTDAISLGRPGILQRRPAILGAFLSLLTVRRIPNSRLIEVQFEAQDPQLAAQIVNTHVQNFIEEDFRSRYEATKQTTKWLESELEELRITVQKSENARVAYERQNQIWAVDEKQNITTQKLGDVSKGLTEAQSDLIQKQAMSQLAHSSSVDSAPVIRDSPVVQDLLRRRADISMQYTEASSQFGPNYPRVQRLQAELKEVEESLAREKQSVIGRVDAEYRGARDRVELLSKALDEQKGQANELSERLVQYNILKHDAESNKQLYDGLLEKLKEAGITAGLRSSNIRVVDPALIPSYPTRPQKARNIFLAFMVGLVGGIGLAFLREYLDNTVKSPDDILTLTGLPSLAVVPALRSLSPQTKQSDKGLLGEGGSEQPRVELVSHSQPKSMVSEAFRALRTSLLLSQADQPPQVILVTSALPREGKTTAAVNLAVTLAQLGDRTLLIDSDLRKPGIRRALGINIGKEAGLSSYLAGVAALDDIIFPHPVITNLAAMPTGPIPPSPADLLSSHRMRDALSYLRQKFKFIVIDSPPIMAATDAVIISALVDGVLLVVRSGETPKEAFTRSRDLLIGVKGRLLGVVLNAVDSSAPDYYYSYRYYPYAYGYGYGEEKAEKQRRLQSESGGKSGPLT